MYQQGLKAVVRTIQPHKKNWNRVSSRLLAKRSDKPKTCKRLSIQNLTTIFSQMLEEK